MSLGDIIDIVIKKEPCINKLYAMKNKYNSHNVVLENLHRAKANTVTHKCRTSSNPK